MYFSIVQEGKFIVVVADGVAEETLIELPTEELADEVAFQLQVAWEGGEAWGDGKARDELDPESRRKEISAAITKWKSMTEEEKEKHRKVQEEKQELELQQIRDQVVSWKKFQGE